MKVLGGELLDQLARQHRLIAFLEEQTFEGDPLLEQLGGWLGQGLAFREDKIVTYHKNWIYFTDLFGLDVVDYVEAKPGIPPSAKHVHRLIDEIKEQQIEVLLAASYFSPQQVEAIAERTGCAAVRVPMGPSSITANSYFEVVDLWMDELTAAFAAAHED